MRDRSHGERTVSGNVEASSSFIPRLRSVLERGVKDTRACSTGRLLSGSSRMRWNTCKETRIIIAGFNALNGCEKQIFTWLQKHGAEFFWDYDHHYTDDAFSEAGRFMRDNLEQFPARI